MLGTNIIASSNELVAQTNNANHLVELCSLAALGKIHSKVALDIINWDFCHFLALVIDRDETPISRDIFDTTVVNVVEAEKSAHRTLQFPNDKKSIRKFALWIGPVPGSAQLPMVLKVRRSDLNGPGLLSESIYQKSLTNQGAPQCHQDVIVE
ncbi:unnamed protein product [Dovyalis caffra]|uniref:Uncharacterized protein n=1 Tax=Dovyalis caffra TaxID=77055 RepID=A0AAV1SPM0_9ROSI|nr:unnamed protein product [Dovyalis caffra]